MNNFVFYSPTEFVFGKDTEMQVGALAGKYGARKVMIVYGGGSVLRSGLLDRVKQSLQKAGIPAGFSFSAGTYLCNYVLYSSLDKIARENKDIKAGFLHVPYAEKEKENAPFLPLDTIVSALELALSNMF